MKISIIDLKTGREATHMTYFTCKEPEDVTYEEFHGIVDMVLTKILEFDLFSRKIK